MEEGTLKSLGLTDAMIWPGVPAKWKQPGVEATMSRMMGTTATKSRGNPESAKEGKTARRSRKASHCTFTKSNRRGSPVKLERLPRIQPHS